MFSFLCFYWPRVAQAGLELYKELEITPDPLASGFPKVERLGVDATL